LKVAVVGTGSVGRRHIENLITLGVEDVIAVSAHSRKDRYAFDGRNVPVLHSVDEVLEAGSDAVVIANPTIFHLPCLRKSVAAGCHVYLEKPAATSADGLSEIAEEAERRNLVVAMGTQNRFHERLETLREAMIDRAAGLILHVAANLGEHIADYHPGEDYRESYTARSDLGGGILLTQIHQIDYLNWIFGPFDNVSAVGGRQSDLEIDVEDNVTYMLRGPSGVPVIGHMDYLQRPKRVTIDVLGAVNSYRWDYFANRLQITPATLDAEATVIETPFDRNALFLRAMKDFLLAARSGGPPRSTLRDGIEALRIVDAIREALATGVTAQIRR
jgi:predicted dehydrogenase